MRHRKKGTTLDRRKGPRESLLKTLVTQVVLYEKVQTTRAKARAVRPMVERLVTHAKKNTLAARRYVAARTTTVGAVKKLFEVLGPRYEARKGGYLRMTKIGHRQGDAAEVVQLEFV